MLPTTPARATHDYERDGTLDLFAALEIATGRVITDLRPSHTSAEFVKFLNKINREVRSPPISTSTPCWTTSPPTRPRRSSNGCCGTSGSTSTSPRSTAPG